DYGNGNRQKCSIFTGETSEFGLSGFVYDNTISGYNDQKMGDFQMKINPETLSCSNCNITAFWKVSEPMFRDLIVEQEPPFSIPTDIILTKVSNTVTLD